MGVNHSRAASSTQPDDGRHLREAFDMIDKDGSGTISVGELGKLLRLRNLAVSDDEVRELIQALDLDHNGDALTFEEFRGAFGTRGAGAGSRDEILDAFVGQALSSWLKVGYTPLWMQIEDEQKKVEAREEHPAGKATVAKARVAVAGRQAQLRLAKIIDSDKVQAGLFLLVVLGARALSGRFSRCAARGRRTRAAVHNLCTAASRRDPRPSRPRAADMFVIWGELVLVFTACNHGAYCEARGCHLESSGAEHGRMLAGEAAASSAETEARFSLRSGLSETQHAWEEALHIISLAIISALALHIVLMAFAYGRSRAESRRAARDRPALALRRLRARSRRRETDRCAPRDPLSLPAGRKFFTNPFHLFDLVVIGAALAMESSEIAVGPLVIVLLLWRVLRIAHAAFIAYELHRKQLHDVEGKEPSHGQRSPGQV
jgi:hypothetical protein